MKIFDQAFERMPINFSSRQFYAEARKFGATETMLNNDIATNFLKRKCKKMTARTWAKKQASASTDYFADDDLEQAIILVKASGLRVLRSKQDWEEI